VSALPPAGLFPATVRAAALLSADQLNALSTFYNATFGMEGGVGQLGGLVEHQRARFLHWATTDDDVVIRLTH
jgi:hypothetical protein